MDEHSGEKSAESVTTAVIVAAGKGERMIEGRPMPKPLVPLLGVPLIARVMRSAARAGIRRFVVVVGHKTEIMREGLPGVLPEGCELEVLENAEFEKPNGVSLLVGAREVSEPFALLMSDHIFSPARLMRAIEHYENSRTNLLVVEDRASFRGDLDDATLVSTEGDKITAIAKDLREYDSIDTGMFVLNPGEIVAALEGAGPEPSISAAMQALSRQGRLEAFGMEGGYWQDVDTPEDLRLAEDKLFNSLIKETDGPIAKAINRRVSIFMSRRLWHSGITPNIVSVVVLALGLLAGAAFSRGATVGWGLLGAFLFQMHSIVDGVDGELARLLHKESKLGFWLDLVADNLTHMAVFGGIAVGQAASGVPGPWAVLGVMAVSGVAVDFAVMTPLMWAESKNRPQPSGALKKLVDALGRREFTYLLFPLAVLELLGWFLWAAAIGTWVYAGTVLFLRMKART